MIGSTGPALPWPSPSWNSETSSCPAQQAPWLGDIVDEAHGLAEGPPRVLPPPLPRQAQHVAVGVELPDLTIFSMITRVYRNEGQNEGGEIGTSFLFFFSSKCWKLQDIVFQPEV